MYYSVDYMHTERDLSRFGWLVLLFVISIMLLIFSPNLISLLLGWDGLGLVSYCLVIYYQNVRSYNAGIITVLSNRIGDVALLLGISWLVCWGGWDIFRINLLGGEGSLFWIIIFSIIAAITRRAQIPFSAWLPAAIAAPTPVSALVHSSTLVTAGVYLMIRFSPLLLSRAYFSWTLLLISTLTIFIAGVCANYETDLRKVIALSTLRQLGLIIISLSLGFVNLAYFHLLTHALFKALLFMCAGAIIHARSENQDVRFIGSLVGLIPVISVCMNVASLALCGFPFLAGFYSKDIIIEMSLLGSFNFFIVFLLMVSVGLTAVYSFRLSFYSMWGDFRGSSGVVADGGLFMNRSVLFLGIYAVFGGRFLSWTVLPVGVRIRSVFDRILILFTVILGVLLGLSLSWNKYGEVSALGAFLGSIWFIPSLSSQFSGYVFIKGGKLVMNVGDYGWGEFIGGIGAYSIFTSSSGILQLYQNNSLKIYLITFLVLIFMRLFLFFVCFYSLIKIWCWSYQDDLIWILARAITHRKCVVINFTIEW